MRVSLIVAASENGVIGRDADLPWRLSADLRRFKRITMGHHLLMGRKTFESIGGPLPGRISLVMSRRADYAPSGGVAVADWGQALERAAGDTELFVIGGAQIYELALPRVDRIYLTRVHAHIEGDVKLPELDLSRWRVVDEQQFDADDRNEFSHTFLALDSAGS
ncbi:MAG: dihydrofolate reductase [Pirellulaceae bacterium]|jgi:dihydrofolate reductase|nr:dihydrofolate reductase [Pirellulaceae bacterium]MDP7016519.1 dihydrofolate reductase [Pirellulaceae bacterium]